MKMTFQENFFHWYILQSWKLKKPQIQLRPHHFWTYTTNLTTVVNRWGTPAYWSLVPRSSMFFYLFEFCLENMWNCNLTQQILSHSFYDWKLNIFVSFGGTLFQQVVGIPMGTNCAPLLADLFLYSYESEFLQNLVIDKKMHEARAFNSYWSLVPRSSMFYLLNFAWKICWAIVSMTESFMNCFFKAGF
jgi:hypothetical protein